ncbi:type II secretion system F family protein [Caldalkalibacillus salinus]|uniref:type II secretion system F family protein n=1 Tax=Caldalkalibacillus salinus TaxID=2803787 RepID=UPI001923ED71|nr:type II secretion system F family protein [Caldalkalibacillus salinus]
MIYVVTLMFGITSLLVFYLIFNTLFLSDRRTSKRMRKYLDAGDNQRVDKQLVNFFVNMKVLKKQAAQQAAERSSKDKELVHMLHRGGVPLKPEEYNMFKWIITIVLGLLLYAIAGNMLFLFVGAAVGYTAPKFWLKQKEKQRTKKFNDNLADTLSTIVGSLRAGFSFPQALKTVVDDADEGPIKEEFGTVLKEMQYGSTLEESLNALKERMPSEDLDLMVQAVVIQRQVGGNLAQVLEGLTNTIRDRVKIQRQIVTLTAQGKLSGRIIGALPVILGFAMYFIDSDYIMILFNTAIGLGMVIFGVIAGGIGFYLVNKVTDIEV